MAKQEFQTESKRLLDLVINSIYSQKEVFLRELISNASDAIDKVYYKALTDDSIDFDQSDYYIKADADKDKRTLIVTDTGIGMTREELEENLGTIAKSGSNAFKQENKIQDGYDIIGQFGIGFYAAFMIADRVTVITRALNSDEAYKWTSDGADGYTIEPATKEDVGTQIIINVKENTEDANYDEFLEEQRLQDIIKKYSDFIRYPIKMQITKSKPKDEDEEQKATESDESSDEDENAEDQEPEYVDYVEEETINSMVPIWRMNKDELTDEDYENFYQEKHYGFDKPLTYLHINVDGNIRYNAILYIPASAPYDYYSKEFEKGLELYSNGVLIKEKSPELLPDYFAFVKGMVDSEDLSLNISREMLQQDRQLLTIEKNIEKKVKKELLRLQKNNREAYEKFYESFGLQLKFGVYNGFGANKDMLEDLLMFYSSTEQKLVTLGEYVERMPEEQKYIYYASGDSYERIAKLPHTETVADKGYEMLYFTEDVDEFAIRMLGSYQEKEFRSVSSGDLGLDEEEENNESEEKQEENKDLFNEMKEILGDKIKEVRVSNRLKSHPVSLSADGEISLEMEKVLINQNNAQNQGIQADKVLEINPNHEVFQKLQEAYANENDNENLKLYTDLLYNQAMLMEGFPVNDPVGFTEDISKLIVS